MFEGIIDVIDDYDISDYGEQLLTWGGVYTVDDAVDKFLECIDQEKRKIEEARQQMVTFSTLKIEDPLGMDYDRKLSDLRLSIIIHEDLLQKLQSDLGRIVDRHVPF